MTDFLTRWLVVVAVALAVFGFGFMKGAQNAERKEAVREVARGKAQIEQMAKSAAQTKAWQTKKDEALNAANKRTFLAREQAATADLGLGRLHDDLAAANDKLSRASVDAVRKYAAAANTVFESCTRRYRGVAGDAQGHSSDSLMYQEAWPK